MHAWTKRELEQNLADEGLVALHIMEASENL